MSRTTSPPLVQRDNARVVGTPIAAINSLQTYSRIEDRSTALPSALREYGVIPAPFSCRSYRCPLRFTTSAIVIARPSPSWPAHVPNW